MPAPRFVAEYENNWLAGGSPKTTSVTCAVGDLLVVIAGSENGTAIVPATPTGGTGTSYTARGAVSVANRAGAWIWSTPVVTTETFTISMTCSNSVDYWGFNVLRFAGRPSPGATASLSTGVGTAATFAITTTAPNSAVVFVSTDWAAADGSTRTYSTTPGTPTEQTYALDSARYTAYGGFYPDVGAPGSKTVGVATPTTQTPSALALEVKGPPPLPVRTAVAIHRAADW